MSAGKQMREDLVSRIAKMGAHRGAIRDTREKLVAHAREQLDTMGPTIATLEHAVIAGQGGILSQRRLRTLLQERERLQRVIANHEARREQQRDDT